jgi:predicted amidophosphoribosyltransferase
MNATGPEAGSGSEYVCPYCRTPSDASAPTCPNCGHTTVRNGACYKCNNCGDSLGCS